MKPLSKAARRALKREYPKLTDAMIDRAEALLVLRTQLDPDRQEDDLKRLDQRRMDLIKGAMPKYAEILSTWRQRDLVARRKSTPVRVPQVTVRRRPAPKKVAGRVEAAGEAGTPTPPVGDARRK